MTYEARLLWLAREYRKAHADCMRAWNDYGANRDLRAQWWEALGRSLKVKGMIDALILEHEDA